MKHIAIILVAVLAILSSCSGEHIASDYDGELCRDLSIKIERRDSLTQHDYSRMIAQDEAILQYLVDRSREICEQPDSLRTEAWRMLTADPEYLERFGYMFTIGSSLYRAQQQGLLDESNNEAYDALDKYNEELASYSDRF